MRSEGLQSTAQLTTDCQTRRGTGERSWQHKQLAVERAMTSAVGIAAKAVLPGQPEIRSSTWMSVTGIVPIGVRRPLTERSAKQNHRLNRRLCQANSAAKEEARTMRGRYEPSIGGLHTGAPAAWSSMNCSE